MATQTKRADTSDDNGDGMVTTVTTTRPSYSGQDHTTVRREGDSDNTTHIHSGGGNGYDDYTTHNDNNRHRAWKGVGGWWHCYRTSTVITS